MSRTDNIPDTDYYMAFAILTAKRSPDPNTQVGACIIDCKSKIVGSGFSDFPNGCENKFPWTREANSPLNTKYMYVIHAEANAIVNASKCELTGGKIFVTLFPCNECAKLIIQSGISEVVYLSDKYAGTDAVQASKRMLDTAGVVYRKFKPSLEKIEIDWNF